MKTAFFSFREYERPFYPIKSETSVFFQEALTPQTMVLGQGALIVSCFVNDVLNAEVIQFLSNSGLKLIALRCAGFNNVDLDAAKNAGVAVVRVPEYSPYAVAEHAVALLLALNRKIHKAYNRVREGNFSIDGLTGFDVHGATIGVIGTGKIGQIFSRIMLGFGAHIQAFDPFPNQSLIEAGVVYESLENLWATSDIISLHCPLMPETHHLINSNSIQKMKKGVFIINTSRGGLIETSAVIEELKSGKISALALDVYEEESGIFFIDHSSDLIQDDLLSRLMTFPNVLITSHQAFLTKTALENIAQTTMNSIASFQNGRPLKYLVN